MDVHVLLSRRELRRLRHGLQGEDPVEHLLALSQLKLSLDGVDADMSKCLRKTVLVQNTLRRSTSAHASAAASDNEEDDSGDGVPSTPVIGDVVAHFFAKPPSATSAGVISFVLRPPTPPPTLASLHAHTAAPACGKAMCADIDASSLAEEAEDTDSPSPPMLGSAKHVLASFAALDPEAQVVPSDDGMVSPPSPPTPAPVVAGRRRSLAEALEDAAAAVAGASSPTKRSRASAFTSAPNAPCAERVCLPL